MHSSSSSEFNVRPRRSVAWVLNPQMSSSMMRIWVKIHTHISARDNFHCLPGHTLEKLCHHLHQKRDCQAYWTRCIHLIQRTSGHWLDLAKVVLARRGERNQSDFLLQESAGSSWGTSAPLVTAPYQVGGGSACGLGGPGTRWVKRGGGEVGKRERGPWAPTFLIRVSGCYTIPLVDSRYLYSLIKIPFNMCFVEWVSDLCNPKTTFRIAWKRGSAEGILVIMLPVAGNLPSWRCTFLFYSRCLPLQLAYDSCLLSLTLKGRQNNLAMNLLQSLNPLFKEQ